MAYIYKADIYCDNCGMDIVRRLGLPDDYNEKGDKDSDDCPVYVPDSQQGETDSVQFCASDHKCMVYIDLVNYGLAKDAKLFGAETRHIGTVVNKNLTSDGIDWLKDQLGRFNCPDCGPELTEYQRAVMAIYAEIAINYNL